MKNIKIEFVIPIALKLAVVIALIIAATTKLEYNYYILLHWFVTASFIYFIYKSYKRKQSGLLIMFVTIALLFNPIIKISLHRNAWQIVDYIVAGLTVGSVIFDLL